MQQVVPVAVGAHFHLVHGDGADLTNEGVNLGLAACCAGATSKLFAVHPAHFSHVTAANWAVSFRRLSVMFCGCAEEEVGVAKLFFGNVPSVIGAKGRPALPFVRNFVLVGEHRRHTSATT